MFLCAVNITMRAAWVLKNRSASALPGVSFTKFSVYAVQDGPFFIAPFGIYKRGTRGVSGDPVHDDSGRDKFKGFYGKIYIFIYR